jgi:hypothetical protein
MTPVNRSVAIPFGIVNILLGVVELAIGMLALDLFLNLGADSALAKAMDKVIPGWFYLEVGRGVMLFILGVGLIGGGIGLLAGQGWARWLCLAVGAVAVLLHAGYLAMQIGWVKGAVEGMQIGRGQAASASTSQAVAVTVAVASVFILHGAALVVAMAFGGAPPPRPRAKD